MYRVESIYTWQCGGLAYPTREMQGSALRRSIAGSCTRFTQATLRGARRYASSRNCALSAQFPGSTFVVRSPMEAMLYSFHHPLLFFNASLQFCRQYVRITLIKIYPSVDIRSIHIALSSQIID